MGGRGRGRGGPRMSLEQFGLSKDEAQGDNAEPPPIFPARTPCAPPAPITEQVKYMLDIGASIKETILSAMMRGQFNARLGVPLELLVEGEDFHALAKKEKKKKKKKGKKTSNLTQLEALQVREDQEDSDTDKGEEDESESGEERVTDDSSDDENSDRSMDENLDYYKNHEVEDDDDAMPSDEDNFNEAAV